MNLPLYKKLILILLNAFLVYYIIVFGINLALRLTTSLQPGCNPRFCSEVINETEACLIKTPGSDNCLMIAGNFFVLSPLLAFMLFGICIGLGFYFSKRFYLSRILIVLLFFAAVVFFIRVLIGAVNLSAEGLGVEFNRTGLNPPVFGEIGLSLFKMFNPKF